MTRFISKNILRATTIALAMGAAIGATTASAADKITIIVGGIEKQIYLPVVLTQQLGYFKDEGLDVELLNTRAGVEAVAAEGGDLGDNHRKGLISNTKYHMRRFTAALRHLR